MMSLEEQIRQAATALGFSHSAAIAPDQIEFSTTFRDICATNACRSYGQNHMCPPLVGEAEALISKVKSYARGVLVQLVVQLEDSFDYEGMMAGQSRFAKLMRGLLGRFGSKEQCLVLGAGACDACTECAAITNQPCIVPHRALSSMEAHCIDVCRTVTAAGLRYNNGENTVSYVGLIMHNQH